MRLISLMALRAVSVVTVFVATISAVFALEPQPAPAPDQLVRETVFNELHDHDRHGYWRYWIEHRNGGQTQVEEQVETVDGPVKRLFLKNGHPLDAAGNREEMQRLQRLINSPSEQARQKQAYAEDEHRIGRILGLLPTAFVYQDMGDENGRRHLRFQPDPKYPAHSIEARVFHSMCGDLWIDVRLKRLARLDGHLEENLDFGFGLLGRLYKGGWFRLERTAASSTDWKTMRLEVHMSGRALLFKSIAHETSELRGGFQPVPPAMRLSQGLAMLEQSAVPTVTPAAWRP